MRVSGLTLVGLPTSGTHREVQIMSDLAQGSTETKESQPSQGSAGQALDVLPAQSVAAAVVDSKLATPVAKITRQTVEQHPIAAVIERLLHSTDDYLELGFVAIPLLARRRRKQLTAAFSRLERYPLKELVSGGAQAIEAQGAHVTTEMLVAIRQADTLLNSRILEVAGRSLFIGLFSEFDAFVGSLLKAIYKGKPELFRSIKREIALSDLLHFDDLQAVMQDMLDKEIDTFRRKSYVEQFGDLEQKFDLRTLRAFLEWPDFVEMSQRRNLMTHNDGRTNAQYFAVCDREGYKFDPRPTMNEQLRLRPNYLEKSIRTVRKVAFMLTHTLWRKIFPEEADLAHVSMNHTVYGLLQRKKWRAAAEFGRFGLQDPMLRGITELDRRIRVVNTAIALKWLGSQPEAETLLDNEDWSASIREFKLANAVLKERFDEAASIMLEIGKSGEMVQQLSYHQWPLFNDFRERREFQDAYESIYGVAFLQKISEEAQQKSVRLGTEIRGGGGPTSSTD